MDVSHPWGPKSTQSFFNSKQEFMGFHDFAYNSITYDIYIQDLYTQLHVNCCQLNDLHDFHEFYLLTFLGL